MASQRSVLVGVTLSAGILFFYLSALEAAEERRTEEEEARAYNVTRVVKTVEGLSFLVQEDRPIEKIAGTYRPIDMDSYVAMKFNKLEKKLQEITETFSKKIEILERRIQGLEAKSSVLTTPDPAACQKAPPKDTDQP